MSDPLVFQQGFKSMAEADNAATQLALNADVTWVKVVAITTDASPLGEVLGYIVVSNQT